MLSIYDDIPIQTGHQFPKHKVGEGFNMSIVNRIVDKVYVINMDKDKERMKSLHIELLKHSIEYTRFSAVVGANVENSKYLTNECNRFCTDGIKGCALSHRAIWEDMILKNYETVLVLEDDIQIEPDFNEHFKDAWDSVPKDFDILWVGCKFLCNKTTVGSALNAVGFSKAYEPFNNSINKTYGSVGTHAYIITRRCADHFLSKTIKWHIDTEMSRWIQSDSLKSYSMSYLPIQTREEAAATSSLSEQYPKLLNSILDSVPLSDTDSVSWILGENHFKLFGYNWNVLSILIVIGMVSTPLSYMWVWVAWISLEFLVSFDTRNTFKMLMSLSIAFIVRLFIKRSNFSKK